MLHTTKILKVLIFKCQNFQSLRAEADPESKVSLGSGLANGKRLQRGPITGVWGRSPWGKAPGGVNRYLIHVWDFLIRTMLLG